MPSHVENPGNRRIFAPNCSHKRLPVVTTPIAPQTSEVTAQKPPSSAALYALFGSELRSFVRSRSGSNDTAEDILQVAFLRAHENLIAGTLPERPRAWLYQIARNLVTDTWRKDTRQHALSEALASEPTGPPTESQPDGAPGPEEDVSALLARALPGFIEQLDAPYRQALQLTEIDGLSHAQAAERQQVSLTCMKSRVRRARGQVLKALQGCCHFEVDARGRVVECTPHSQNSSSHNRCG